MQHLSRWSVYGVYCAQLWWIVLCWCCLQALQRTTPLMRQQQAYKYTGQRTNFFALIRFDLMLDENDDTYLIEVCERCEV